jgi:hypothetical protein
MWSLTFYSWEHEYSKIVRSLPRSQLVSPLLEPQAIELYTPCSFQYSDGILPLSNVYLSMDQKVYSIRCQVAEFSMIFPRFAKYFYLFLKRPH